MKKSNLKNLLAVFLVLMTVLGMSVTLFGASDSSLNGWHTDSDGVERYYEGGAYVTGNKKIGDFTYVFGSDGAYIGMYDNPKAVGTVGVMDSDAYKNAISALGDKVYLSMPIEPEVNKITYNRSGIYSDIVAGEGNEVTGEKSNYIYGSSALGVYPCINVHLKSSKFEFISKSNGKLAVKTTQSETDIDPFINVYTKKYEAGTDYVFEAEYKLGENFEMAKSTLSLMQVIDRDYPGGSYFFTLLEVNSEGLVQTSRFSKSRYICQLSEHEFTRLSVSVHPLSDTYDIYVNGVLVAEGVTYVDSGYDASVIVADEFRMFQYGGAYRGTSMCVDNIYVYGASKPVCTEEAEARNGVYYNEGAAYLRNYENNVLVGGRVELSGTYFGRTFDKETVIFDKYGRYFVGSTASMVVDGSVSKTETVLENTFVAPTSPGVAEGRTFIGWKVTDASGNSTFLRAEESLRIDSNITYEPISVCFDMLDGASVKTDKAAAELRYMARISKADHDTLTSLGVSIEAHIVTMPTEYIEKTYGYTTVDALKDLDPEVYNEWKDNISSSWYRTTDNFYYYTASVTDIPTKDLMRDHSAVGYLKLVDKNGKETLIYTDYDEENNARSVYEVAVAAYNDRVSKKADGYSKKIKFNGKKTYSPYSKTRLSAVKSFVDNVIDITADDLGVRASGEYYEAPYKITFDDDFGEYSIKIKSSGSWSVDSAAGFVLNGEVLGDDGYKKGDGEYSVTIEIKKSELSSDKVEKNYETWYLTDVENSSDASFFNGGKVRLPVSAPNGESRGFRWNFSSSSGSKQNVTFFSGKTSTFGWSMDEDGNSTDERYEGRYDSEARANVVDMSDWQTLTFYYYASEDFVGSKFMIIANSENPNVDGSDYYSKSYTVTTAGWNKVVVSKNDFSISRSPLGWDKITGFNLSNHGWSMEEANGDYDQYLYFTSMTFSDDPSTSETLGIDQLEDAAAFYPGGYAGVVNSKLYTINESNSKAVVFIDGETYYLPVSVFAAGLSDSATLYDTGNTVVMEMNGSKYRFTASKTYEKDGEKVKLKNAIRLSEGSLFISDEDAMTVFGYTEKYIDRMGLLVLSNTKDLFDSEADFDAIYDVIEECTYVRPTGEKVYEDLMSYSGGVHPYIMLDQSDFDRLNYYKKKDSTLKSYITTLAVKYDVGGSVYVKAPVEYALTDGVRLLSISREAMARTRSFALLYKLYEYDDPERALQLAERLWDELNAVCNFQDWHPAHYLDTAEMAYAVAIGYDWLYDYWKAYDEANGTNRLGIMEEALYNYSLKTTSALGGTYNLAGSTNNWNGVCNGGTMTAALALVTNPKYREDAMTVIGASIIGVERGMWVYAPDGGYEEGPGYWGYGTTYLSVYMSALDSACGTTYGLYSAPGFAHSVYFTTYIGSLNTSWGFHDGGSGAADTSIAAWFAKKSNDGNVNAIRRQAIENGWVNSSWYDIVWFSPHTVNDSITLELDAYYSLDTIMTFRDSWDSKNTIFTGLHGGDNQASHGDLDIGNFIISVDGTHIICDLGADAYNIAGYFGNYRWSYYRKRAEGQNTLVMLPHGKSWNGTTGIPTADLVTNTNGSTNKPKPDQISTAVSECLRYETGTHSALGVIDMAPAYADYIGKDGTAIRGLWFKDDRSTIVIQDEGTYKQSMDIWWFAHTKGDITISEDGKSAIIEQNGIYLYAELVTDIESATFYASDAVSLDKNYAGDTTHSDYFADDVELSRAGISKLCVKAENVTEYKLAVVFKVISGIHNAPERGTTYTWTDIKDWKVD